MARLIDANWILGEIEHDLGCYEIENVMQGDGLYVELRDVVRMVCAAPTVDAVEVVHGRWEKAEYHGFLRCSECKDVYIDDTWVADGKWNYCPNCGAKMDGERKDNG